MKITLLLLLIPVLLLLLIFMKVCKQKCIEGIEFEIKNNVKKSLDKKIKDKKSVSKIVDKYTTELQNCYNVKNVSFDQFIYPESTNNLELKKCVGSLINVGVMKYWSDNLESKTIDNLNETMECMTKLPLNSNTTTRFPLRAAECAGERSWWKPDIFGTRN
ncbi:216R [Invertebrate iridescent virus Kaz2018]|nr:216R [Invertebrate iridescent virus Kaz2018]